jgi:hypothetical protein
MKCPSERTGVVYYYATKAVTSFNHSDGPGWPVYPLNDHGIWARVSPFGSPSPTRVSTH